MEVTWGTNTRKNQILHVWKVAYIQTKDVASVPLFIHSFIYSFINSCGSLQGYKKPSGYRKSQVS
jgi:hypothetical protein